MASSARVASASVLRGVDADALDGALRKVLPADLPPEVAVDSENAARGATVLAALADAAPVDQRVVEAIVDILDCRGWGPVTVVAAGLDPAADGQTPRGTSYRLAEVHKDMTVAPAPDSSVLHGRRVSTAWTQAALRIVLARSVTDLADGYAGCVDLLADVVEPTAEATRADLAADVLEHLPATVAVVDALVTSRGLSGRGRLDPMDTAALVVGDDALLVDVVLARLLGLDPAVSRPVGAAMRSAGLPAVDEVSGDLTPFQGGRAAPAAVREAVRSSGPAGERVAAGILGTGESDRVMSALRTGAAALAEQKGEQSLAAGLAAGALATAYVRATGQAWATVLDKSRLDRVDVPLAFDPAGYVDADYRALPDVLSPFEALLAAGTHPGELCWLTVDKAVVFKVSQVLQAPFDLFVERVDVARGISLMADYIGGRVVTVARDELGRPTQQAERNIYLPEPNYLALWGGLPIDVCKIELVEYHEELHRLSWRTVRSPNGSATYDDGSLTFAAEGDSTRVTVLGRQLFTLPPFWQAVDLDRFPDIKAPLVEDAYRRFFAATFANLEACFEGRDHRIGRDPVVKSVATEQLSAVVDLADEWLTEKPVAERLRDLAPVRTGPVPVVDADGFRHFPGPAEPALEPDDATDDAGRSRWRDAARQLAEDYTTALGSDLRRGLQ
jgi:hypothetical protein